MKNGNGVVYSLIGIMFISIIGVYGWTFKVSERSNEKLAEILKTINSHIQVASIHTNKKEFILAEVFRIANENIKEDLVEIKADVKTLLKR